MKTVFLLILLCCGYLVIPGSALAQSTKSDEVYKRDRSMLNVKVREVTSSDLFYSELATPGISRKLPKADLWKVVFADGTSEVFNLPKAETSQNQPTASAQTTPATYRQAVQTSSEPKASARTKPGLSAPTESTDGPQSIIKYAPLSSLGYEKVLGNNRSIYAGISLYSVNTYFTRVTAIGLKGEYRFYGLAKSSPKQAPEGFWVAPTVLLWNVSIRDLDFYDTESAFVAQIGGIAGYQWIFNKKITLEPALGLSLTAVGTGTESILGAGVVPLFAVRVGYVLK